MKCVDCKKKNGSVCLDDEVRCKECKAAKWPGNSVQSDTTLCNDQELNETIAPQRPGDFALSQMSKGPIVNELLCFVVNKMDTLPFDYLVKLCSDFYSESEIDAAKEIISKLGPTDKRYPKRKGQNKKVTTVQDILRIMLELETNLIPVFVARDLGNLTPLSYEHFDVSKLLHDIEVVRNEVNLIKFSIPSLPLGTTETRHGGQNANPKIPNTDSTQPLSVTQTNKNAPNTVIQGNKNSDPAKTINNEGLVVKAQDKGTSRTEKEQPRESKKVDTNVQPQMESTNNASSAELEDGQPWTIVTNKRVKKKPPFISGTAKGVAGGLQVATKPPRRKCIGIFVSRLHCETTAEQVKDHVLQKLDTNFKIKKLETKFKTYSSFLVETGLKHVQSLLDPDIWPEGTLIKRYYESEN